MANVQCPLSPLIWSMWLAIDFPFHDSSIVKQLISKCANKEASVADALNLRDRSRDERRRRRMKKKSQIVQFLQFRNEFRSLKQNGSSVDP